MAPKKMIPIGRNVTAKMNSGVRARHRASLHQSPTTPPPSGGRRRRTDPARCRRTGGSRGSGAPGRRSRSGARSRPSSAVAADQRDGALEAQDAGDQLRRHADLRRKRAFRWRRLQPSSPASVADAQLPPRRAQPAERAGELGTGESASSRRRRRKWSSRRSAPPAVGAARAPRAGCRRGPSRASSVTTRPASSCIGTRSSRCAPTGLKSICTPRCAPRVSVIA